MGKGDCIFITAKYLKEIEPPLVFENRSNNLECCYELPVFWDDNINDPDYKYHHDFSSWIVFCEQSILNVYMFLERWSGSDWEEVQELTDNNLGTYFGLGFITNRLDQKAAGYLLDWNKVNDEHGDGEYRIRFDQSYKFGINTAEYSFSWTLHKWNEIRANETIRVEWNNNGEQGWFGKRRVDFYGKNFYGQVRLPNSYFGFPKDGLEQEFVQYQDGRQEFKTRTITERYSLEVVKAPATIHKYLQILIRSAYNFTITDYNLNNTESFKDYQCVFISASEPQWSMGTNLATVNYELEEYIKNKTIYT